MARHQTVLANGYGDILLAVYYIHEQQFVVAVLVAVAINNLDGMGMRPQIQ